MAETRPLTVCDGQAQLSDIFITAGFLSLSATAWDGKRFLYFAPPQDAADDRAAYEVYRKQAGIKTIRIEWDPNDGSHTETVPTLLRSDWVDKSAAGQGHHYRAGEVAPMPRVVFHLRGAYEEFRGGSTAVTPWGEDEWMFWFRRWHKRGDLFPVIGAKHEDRLNRLRNHIRDRYRITAKLKMPFAEVRNG